MAEEQSATTDLIAEDRASSKPVQSIEAEADVKEEDEADDGSDREGANDGVDPDEENDGRPVSNTLYRAFKSITDILLNHKIKVKFRGGEEEHFPSTLFKRLPNKRNLPDYYEVIKEPSAISTLKGKIQRKTYSGVPEFVRDFALIVHNAQIYNKPNSAPVRDVLRLDAIFKDEMKRLVDQGHIKEEETAFPDLGEIPYATPEPDPLDEDEAEPDDEPEEDEEDEEGDDSDDDRRKKRRRARPSISGKKPDREDDDEGDKAGTTEEQKRRGRPPKVDTPMEARIKAILKGIRKMKNDDGQLIAVDFERLPDKTEHAAYYQVIKEPIALDLVKKKAKRKKYDSVDNFMKDIELMFKNAMLYNEDASPLYNNAQSMLEETKKLAEAEKSKPDEEYLMQDGRLPLPYIEYKNQIWKIGDWIHIQNPNDVTKPIVAQIYRTWQDENKQKWINACWYYRPEQTIHQYEKHFWEKEVVKTGQYRDHHIEEVLEKCFVMFFTRYGRGRPRDIGSDCEVYVCEARYNEDKSKFNKIKTWASCLPDEVRDKDYEMDLFDVPKRIKKQPSPLLKDPAMLLSMKEEEKADDPIPEPQWGHANAPPIVGGIYKRPRDENQSPPPEPTPPPPPTPPPLVRQPSSTIVPNPQHRPSIDHQASNGASITPQVPRPSPLMTPQATSYQNAVAAPAAVYSRPPYNQPGVNGPYPTAQSQTPAPPAMPYTAQQQLHPPGVSAAHLGNYAAPIPVQAFNRPNVAAYQPPQQHQYTAHAASGYDQRRKEVYVLSDQANAAIPKEVRDRYPQDDHGRVLFFDKPPVNTKHIIEDQFDSNKGKPLEHSEKYLEAKKERDTLIADRKRQREAREKVAVNDNKRLKATPPDEERHSDGRTKADLITATELIEEKQQKKNLAREKLEAAIELLRSQYADGLSKQYQAEYGSRWQSSLWQDLQRGGEIVNAGQSDRDESARLIADEEKKVSANRIERYRRELEENRANGFVKDSWVGVYHDDTDPRLP